ncbi:hypothetical protein [Paenibacillus validus]|uniref:hypothetical protein n=1 Tax=Paenibacillus validus TaxID=44253 RepID=UPI003D29D715
MLAMIALKHYGYTDIDILAWIPGADRQIQKELTEPTLRRAANVGFFLCSRMIVNVSHFLYFCIYRFPYFCYNEFSDKLFQVSYNRVVWFMTLSRFHAETIGQTIPHNSARRG